MGKVISAAVVIVLTGCGAQYTVATPRITPAPTVSAVSTGEGPQEVPVPKAFAQLSSREMPLGSTATKVAEWSSDRGELVIAMTPAGHFECQLEWLEPPTGEVKALSNGCGRVDPGRADPLRRRLLVNASGSGADRGGMLAGTLPEGATLVAIEANGLEPLYLRPYDAGAQWQHRRFFVANVPLVRPTTVKALTDDGKVVDSYAESYV